MCKQQKAPAGATLGIYFPLPADDANEVRAAVAQVAAQLGYVADGGRDRGKAGSIGKLLTAIARGDVRLVPAGEDVAPPVHDAADVLV